MEGVGWKGELYRFSVDDQTSKHVKCQTEMPNLNLIATYSKLLWFWNCSPFMETGAYSCMSQANFFGTV